MMFMPDPTWPPDIDELSDSSLSNDKLIHLLLYGKEAYSVEVNAAKPLSLVLFLERLLHATDRKRFESITHRVNSYGADITSAVSTFKEKIVTSKQFLLALGPHNITGKIETYVIIILPITKA